MLIEVKEPSAVIPLTEYNHLKKIEDNYLDAIEELKVKYQKNLDTQIASLVNSDDSVLVIWSTADFKNTGGIFTRTDKTHMEKFLKGKDNVRMAEDKDKESLVEMLKRNFKIDKAWK